MGIILDSLYLGGTSSDFNLIPFWKSVLRLIVSLVILTPFILMNQLISPKDNTMILFIFAQVIPYFTATLIMFSVIKFPFTKLNLVKANN